MRMMRFEFTATVKSLSPGISLEPANVRRQFFQELQEIVPELTELCRRRIASYFPADYSVFVRIALAPDTGGIRFVIWIDDPTIRWPAGLLARRAWKLSVPVLAHAVSDAFAERLQGVQVIVDRQAARITALAPRRIWSDPVVMTVMAAAASAVAILYVLPPVVTRVLTLAGY